MITYAVKTPRLLQSAKQQILTAAYSFIFSQHVSTYVGRPSLRQRCQKQKQAVHKTPNYSHVVYGCFSVITSLEVMACCGIPYVVYSLCGYRIKGILNGVAIYKFLYNSGHRRKDTSRPHTGVSASVHNYSHLVTANLHNEEVGNVRL